MQALPLVVIIIELQQRDWSCYEAAARTHSNSLITVIAGCDRSVLLVRHSARRVVFTSVAFRISAYPPGMVPAAIQKPSVFVIRVI